ncbi:MAG: hypothetical protein WCP03_00515 [Candidatus Saccharibacteria bacterium]
MKRIKRTEVIVMVVELVVIFVASYLFYIMVALVSCFDSCPLNNSGPHYLPFFLVGLTLLIVTYLLQDILIFKKISKKNNSEDKKK